ncbi:hypothetical protein ACHMW7_09060 [Aminobacter sp. UC22_36]|uniref:hypothetical protein n=1 Tax=Aminobacter sp. UC22_36 TaxID=3374549 RepID=UPI003756FFF0
MITYDTSEFIAKMSKSDLQDPEDTVILGLVKPDEKNQSAIYFSNSLSCDRWLSIPAEIIESVDHLRSVRCADHEHPLVKIRFKKPDEARQDLVFLFSLITQQQAAIAGAIKTLKTSRNFRDGVNTAPSRTCFILEIGGSLEICCWDDNTMDCTGIV